MARASKFYEGDNRLVEMHDRRPMDRDAVLRFVGMATEKDELKDGSLPDTIDYVKKIASTSIPGNVKSRSVSSFFSDHDTARAYEYGVPDEVLPSTTFDRAMIDPGKVKWPCREHRNSHAARKALVDNIIDNGKMVRDRALDGFVGSFRSQDADHVDLIHLVFDLDEEQAATMFADSMEYDPYFLPSWTGKTPSTEILRKTTDVFLDRFNVEKSPGTSEWYSRWYNIVKSTNDSDLHRLLRVKNGDVMERIMRQMQGTTRIKEESVKLILSHQNLLAWKKFKEMFQNRTIKVTCEGMNFLKESFHGKRGLDPFTRAFVNEVNYQLRKECS